MNTVPEPLPEAIPDPLPEALGAAATALPLPLPLPAWAVGSPIRAETVLTTATAVTRRNIL